MTDEYLYASIGDGGCDYADGSGCAGANDTVTNATASGFAAGTADLVIDVTGWWGAGGGLDPRRTMSPCANFQ